MEVLNNFRIRKESKNLFGLLLQQIQNDSFFKVYYAYLLVLFLPFLKLMRLLLFRFYIPIVFKLNGGLKRTQKLFKIESNDREKYPDIESATSIIFSKLKDFL